MSSESLDMAGTPIQSFFGVDGGYQLMEDFVFEKQLASKHEYDWIIAALQGMASAYAIRKQHMVRFSYTNSHDEINLTDNPQTIRNIRLYGKAPIKERFHGKYPARKSIQTEFADNRGLLFQVDAVAYCGK